MTAGAAGVLLAVCAVVSLHPDAGPVGVTAIDKRPVPGPVAVGSLGLRGDVQADRRHHGGPDKALYALDAAELLHWGAELGEPVPPGRFGENLLVGGLPVDDAELGERWRLGTGVEVEVTMPRTPCATFGRWLGQEGWVRRYAARGRPGVYLRVLTGGTLTAGDPVEVVHRPGHGVTAARWFTAAGAADARTLLAAAAGGALTLAPDLRVHLDRALARP